MSTGIEPASTSPPAAPRASPSPRPRPGGWPTAPGSSTRTIGRSLELLLGLRQVAVAGVKAAFARTSHAWPGNVRELERETIKAALKRNRGNISQTASELGISRPTLYGLLTKFSIERP